MKQSRDAWLAERKLGLGGSDTAHLFELEPHGCLLRLWYDKSGIAPDFPAEDGPLLRRGRALEDLAADEYVIRTGRKLVRRKARVSARYPWARVNLDREILGESLKGGPGPLEIKTHGREVFAKVKREGIRRAHRLQLQHAMLVTGASWGAFAVLQPDTWALYTIDVERDERSIEEIVSRGEAFWPRVHDHAKAPAKVFGPGDPRCKACPWRVRCHGQEAALVPGLSAEERAEPLPRVEAFAELLVDYESAKRAADEALTTIELIREEIRSQLGAGDADGAPFVAIECSAGRVYYRVHTRASMDTAQLRTDLPEIAAKYTRTTQVRPLRIYTRPGEGTD